jgi:predicted 3-demethylubiquinone-9 3-methyltransferase (glyoxalase superfamily)
MKTPLYPCLWFDGKAHEAAEFYCSVFDDSSIESVNPMVVIFQIMGQKYMGLNGGPVFKFNEAVSFVIDCETQEEIDYYWGKLSGRRRRKSVWLAEGPLWTFVAGGAHYSWKTDERSTKGRTRDAGFFTNEKV